VSAAPANTPKPSGLEIETCSRCAGSGKHSYCQMYGSTCFKCGGSGRTYTKRGAAAAAKLTDLRSKPASELVPGDTVLMRGFSCGSVSSPSKWCKVAALEDATGSARYKDAAGEWVTPTQIRIVFEPGAGYSASTSDPATMYRVRQGAAALEATLAEALEYQATLTKTGKPRKR